MGKGDRVRLKSANANARSKARIMEIQEVSDNGRALCFWTDGPDGAGVATFGLAMLEPANDDA